MFTRFFGTVIFAVLVTTGAHAQDAASEHQAEVQVPDKAPVVVTKPTTPQGQPVNAKLELTITDQMGPGEPAKKTVTLVVADRSDGSIRSSGNNVPAALNVDARPEILSNGSIRLQLGLQYNPRQGGAKKQPAKIPSGDTIELPEEEGGTSLNERVTIILEPGKPLILSQAADPISDRKITVEVRASILK